MRVGVEAVKKGDEEIRKMMGLVFFFGGWVREDSTEEGIHLALALVLADLRRHCPCLILSLSVSLGLDLTSFAMFWERRDLIRTTNKIGIKTYARIPVSKTKLYSEGVSIIPGMGADMVMRH